MKAGQLGPQLSARVLLNHDLVTDCACVHKGMCTFTTRWRSAFSLRGRQAALGRLFMRNSWSLCTVTGPRQIGSRGCEDGHISFTLGDATHFYCPLSIFKPRWRVGPTCMANTCRYQHTHTLSLSFCVYAAGYVYIRVRLRQRVWSVWTVTGLEFSLFWFRFFLGGGGFTKVTLTLCVSCNSPIFSQFDFCGYCCWSVIRINTGYTSKIIIWWSSHTCFTLTDTTRYLLSSLEIIRVGT